MSSSASDHNTTPGKSPAFQFYPKDFLGDGDQAGMSLQETGAYARLMCFEWNAHGKGLPDDSARCARMVGSTAGAMRKMWPAIRALFVAHQSEVGRIVHPRLEREREKQDAFRRRQSDKGKASAANRKPTDSQPETNHGSTPVASGLQPKPNSSIFDLRSSSSPSGVKSVARGVTGGVMAGSLPRDHMNCRQPCIRVCLSEKQHGILREKHGGNDADLDAFYADVRSRLDPGTPIGEAPWKFWDAQFNARFGAAVVVNPRTAGNEAAAARFVARRQGA